MKGGSGLTVGKKRQKKEKLNHPHCTIGEPRWCPCPRLPKYTLGGKQRRHFADSIWELACGQSILRLQHPCQEYLCACESTVALLGNRWPNLSGADHIFTLFLPSTVSQAWPFTEEFSSIHGSIWNLCHLPGQRWIPIELGQSEGKVLVPRIARAWGISKGEWGQYGSCPQRGSTYSVSGIAPGVAIPRWRPSLGLKQFPVQGGSKPAHAWRPL